MTYQLLGHPISGQQGRNPSMFSEDQLLPISALQHFLFCPRQCALIHLEREWEENLFTAQGRVIHRNVHEEGHQTQNGIRIERGIGLRSLKFGITGQADVVEFHENGSVVPVEYKRGKPKSNGCDKVQLCAQAICLEEMLNTNIDSGFLFYGKRKRRTETRFDQSLRNLTHETIGKLHEMVNSRKTPLAVYDKKCDSCSLKNTCMPNFMRLKNSVAQYVSNTLKRLEVSIGPKTDDLEVSDANEPGGTT